MFALSDQIAQYLRADGYVVNLHDGLIHAVRQNSHGFDYSLPQDCSLGDSDVVIWPVEDQAAANGDNQKRFLETVLRQREVSPKTHGIYVAAKGVSFTGIETLIKRYGLHNGNVIKRRAPIQYFDTPYTQDESVGRDAKSVLDEVLERGAQDRVPQPFAILKGSDINQPLTDAGADLAAHLFQKFTAPFEGPKVTIVDGPAGSGKSNLFDAHFFRYYQHFMSLKRAHEVAPRPVLFLPAHMRDDKVGNMGELMKQVFESDLASPVTKEQFRWLLLNGFSVWMFDGLDEFYAGETDFFEFLDAALEEEGSLAQFLICTRNSLLNTSGRLIRFVDKLFANAPEKIELYQLMPWNENQWRQLAKSKGKSFSLFGGANRKAEKFVKDLNNSPDLKNLAELPFYCDRLYAYWQNSDGKLPEDEFVILEQLVDDMFQRERGKLPFDWNVFVDDQKAQAAICTAIGQNRQEPARANAQVAEMLDRLGKEALFELLGVIAHFKRRHIVEQTGKYFDLEISDLIELFLDTHITLPDTAHMGEDYRRLLVAMVHFALFAPGSRKGTIDFAHEQIAEYLAARYTVRSIQQRPDQFNSFLGNAPLKSGSLYVRFLQKKLGRDSVFGPIINARIDQGEVKH